MPGIDETANFFRVRLRDPDQFTRLRQIPFKRAKPRIFAIVGRLRGETSTTLQALMFPKEDGWSRDSVSSWMREHPDVGKEWTVEECTQKQALDAGVVPWVEDPADETNALWEQLVKTMPLGGLVHKTYAVETKDIREDEFEVDAVISSAAVDRDREVVRPEGLRIMKPKRVPLVASHSYGSLLKHIGELSRIRPDGEQVTARARYFAGMGNQEADWGWTLVKLGVAAYSIGFRPMKIEEADLNDEKVLERVRAGKEPLRTYLEWELVETSHVIVPSQREAVQREVAEAVTKGLIDQPFADRIARAIAEEIEREGAAAKADDILAEVLGKDAVEDAAVFYALEPKQGERWVVGGARGLPLLEDDAWDATAAVAAWRRFSGATSNDAMKDRAVQRRYRRGFILFNQSAPENLGSYKFPFVKVDGGRAKASRRGLVAARVVLAGGRNRPNMPAPMMDAAERFVNGYLGKPEGDGKAAALVIPRVVEVSLAALREAEADAVLVLDEDGGTLFRGAPTELSDLLEREVGRPAEVHQHLTLDVRPIEVDTDALDQWAERAAHLLTSKLKAAFAEGAKAPDFPADSVALLTRKDLAETIVSTARKVALQELKRAAGDVDAFREGT